MQSNRAVWFVLLLFVLVGVGFWALAAGDPAAPSAPGAGPAAATNKPDAATGTTFGSDVEAKTTSEASVERSTAATAVVDPSVPAIIGQLVDPSGKPVEGAEVVVAAGLGMLAASGAFDFTNIDSADLSDMDPQQMMGMSPQALENARTTTAADGRFRVVPVGSSRGLGLRAMARGFVLLDRRATRPVAADVDLGTLTLEPGAIVAGRVIDAQGGAVEGAVVSRLLDMEKGPMAQFEFDMPEMQAVEQLRFGDTCKTDMAGRFELAHLPPGEFVLRARHPAHPTTRKEAVAAVGTTSELTITMPIGAEIRGMVVDMPKGTTQLRVVAAKKPGGGGAAANPMLGMFGEDPTEMFGDMGMPFGERTAEVAANGEFVVRGLRQDTYRIWLSQVGVGFAGSTACSEKQEVAAGSHGVQLRYEPGVRVTFVVVDKKTGAPIERLWVSDRLRGGGGFGDIMGMMPGNGRQKDYPDGAVTLANLRPKPKQTLTLDLSAVGYSNWQRADIALPTVGTIDLGTLELEPRPVVQVTVIAADTGLAVVGARVKVVANVEGDSNPFSRLAGMNAGGGPQSGKTDAEGRCVLNAEIDKEGGESKGYVEVDSPKHAPFVSEAILFAAVGKTEYMARLVVGGRVEVSVVDPAGKPVAGTAVEQRDAHGQTKNLKTDAEGRVRFDRLAPGKHDFRLGDNAGPMANLFQARGRRGGDAEAEAELWQSIEVVDQVDGKLQLTKSPTATVHGVVRENGLPLVGARVSFVEGDRSAEQEMAEQMMGGMLDQLAGGAGGRSAKTDDTGAFSLKELPDGAHRLRITHKERSMPALVPVLLQNGDNLHDIELDMTSIRGVVRDPEGNAVAGARVSVRVVRDTPSEADDIQESIGSMMPFATPGGIKSDDDGSFTLRGVDPDVPLKVVANAKGFVPATASVTVARGTTSAPLELHVATAGRIKVTTQDNAPFAAVRGKFVGEGEGQAPVMQMLRKGKGTLDGLRPGLWELSYHGMQDGGEGEKKRTIEVVAGQTVEVEF